MVVKELIEELSKYPSDMEVMIWIEANEYPGWNGEIVSVKQRDKQEPNYVSNRFDKTQVVSLS